MPHRTALLTMAAWSTDQIALARQVDVSTVLNYLEAYHKVDKTYSPIDKNRKSIRVQVNYQGRDFRFVFTGEKWINELAPIGTGIRGGGGAIDFVIYITGLGFVQAVKICLDAASSRQINTYDFKKC